MRSRAIDRTRRPASRRLAVLATLAACAVASCGDASPDEADTERSMAVIEHHVDGDTIDVLIDGTEERIRFTGIDTPEIAHPGSPGRAGNDAECFGDAAAAFTEALLPLGTEVRLERDVVGRDDYGRLLAYIYRAEDGLFVNEEIVRRGFAQPLTIPPNVAYAERFVEAARQAERDDIGLWAECRDG